MPTPRQEQAIRIRKAAQTADRSTLEFCLAYATREGWIDQVIACEAALAGIGGGR